MQSKNIPKQKKPSKKLLKHANTPNTNTAGERLHDVVICSNSPSTKSSDSNRSEVFFTNRLQEIILKKTGAASFTPSKETLKKLNMGLRRFNKIYRKNSNPTFEETILLLLHYNARFTDFWSWNDASEKTNPELDEKFKNKYGL